MKTDIKLIAGFPGVGKSTLLKNIGLKISDSDSSTFPKDNFPQNYIDHIKDNVNHYDYMLISSHKDVRNALVEEGMDFVLVFPDKSIKDEYLERYRKRNSPESFINLLNNNWDNWILECETQIGCEKYQIQSGQYLSTVMDRIMGL